MAEYTRAQIVRRIATTGHLRLAGSDLAGLDLSGLTLVEADLSYADLTRADLTEAQLPASSLWSARAAGARFRNANLSGANLGLADLSDADLRGAILERADLTGARLDRADLSDARLRGAWLDTMQRALAMGAPPLRYPVRRPPVTHILRAGQIVEPVTLRCGDRLEVHLDSLTEAAVRHPDLARVEGAPILAGPELPQALAGPPFVLTFSAIAPGRGRLVLQAGADAPLVGLGGLVSP